MIMSTVGRGGEGDVGQRIRDEILVIQVKLLVAFSFLLYTFYLFSSACDRLESCELLFVISEKQ